MDHLPVPEDRNLGSISIPFLASDEYSSPFHDYPQRNGWNLSFPANMQPQLQHTSASLARRDLGGLLQTWLYFGMLSEFLGEPVDVDLFRRHHESGDLLVSTSLEKLVCDRTASLLEHARIDGSDFLLSFREAFRLIMLKVRHYVLLVVRPITDPFDDLSRICLSITVMAEYLVTALFNLCQRCQIETTLRQNWRVFNTDDFSNPDILILKLMSQRGWCAYDIALLDGTQVQNVSTLYFLANLSPPKANFSHSSCTSERCVPMQVEKSEYIQAHTTTGCDCASVGLDQEPLAAIIRSGDIPLISLSEGQITIRRCTRDTKFVTISHVWADGMGNPSGNLLPICIVLELQQLVDDVCRSDGTPFWIDTFCIPRRPLDLKTEALLRMREPYEQATHVLVLDSYLRKFSAAQVSQSELLARIAVCGWSQRLWTFQEGRLPQSPARVIFAFRDKLVDLFVEVLTRNRLIPHFPTLASLTVHRDLLFGHRQTALFGPAGLGFDQEFGFSMSAVREALRTRQTSRAADEALCIGGGILKLPESDMREIIQANAELRMIKIWHKIKAIPTGIVFSKAPHKLETKGYRWAPASFMGSFNMSLQDWEGPNSTIHTGLAAVTTSGLLVKLPAWKPGVGDASCQEALMEFCDVTVTPSGEGLFFLDDDKRWFVCVVGDEWNRWLEHSAPAEHLLLIHDGSPDYLTLHGHTMAGQDKFVSQGHMKGLLASYGHEQKDGHPLLTIHRHLDFYLAPVSNYEIYPPLKLCAEKVCDDYSEVLVSLRADKEGLHKLVSTITHRFLEDTPEALVMVRASNEYHGWGDSSDVAVNDCIRIVKSLVKLGPCGRISKANQSGWCVT